MFEPLDYLAGYWTGKAQRRAKNVVTEHSKARRLHDMKCYELELWLSLGQRGNECVQEVSNIAIGLCEVQYALQLDNCRELILFQFIRDAEEEVVDAVDKIIEVVDNG